ncbi:MAG: hypothetical protein OXI75_13490 [Rhodospirillales bacterium]|nr:hypothetical protein [Rhodospirillales bacterium]
MDTQPDKRLKALKLELHETKKRLSYLEGLVEGLRIAVSLPRPLPPPHAVSRPDLIDPDDHSAKAAVD